MKAGEIRHEAPGEQMKVGVPSEVLAEKALEVIRIALLMKKHLPAPARRLQSRLQNIPPSRFPTPFSDPTLAGTTHQFTTPTGTSVLLPEGRQFHPDRIDLESPYTPEQ